MIKKMLGQILVEQGALSAHDVSTYQQEAEKEKIPFARYIQEKKIVSQEAIAQAYAVQSGLPYLEKINDEMADPLLLAKVPLRFLRENNIIPLKEGSFIVLAVANPIHFAPIDDLNVVFGNQTKTVVATTKVIIDALNHY